MCSQAGRALPPAALRGTWTNTETKTRKENAHHNVQHGKGRTVGF